ncbi:hypothetical protein NQ317_018118 [Molorchus minor]|uniref:RING-type domain-containing protein n=1 Tax=Molorchus minor TaxID=1323400 RepID=A0ABQ9J1P3_9CUCU|nr:hypothetical protein NQ317_018118 [Molorchus minor]
MSDAAVVLYNHCNIIPKKPIAYSDEVDNRSKPLSLEGVQSETNYRNFNIRLATFENWPNTEVSQIDLAQAGFIYTGEDDIVVCPFCKIEGYRWVSGDIPMDDHTHWRPNCPFVRSTIEHDHAPSTSRNLDTCGLYGVEILPNSVPEDNNSLDYKRLGIHKIKGALYEDKISYESRLATFDKWPKSLKQRPAELAEAGFYYTGVGDQTLCFYCGGGLKDWEENDEPWEQHALWFSKCGKDSQASTPSTSSETTKDEPQPEALSEKCEKSDKETEAAEKTLCKICYKNELGVVFLPCGHIVACVDCAAALKNCAVCRRPLEATVRHLRFKTLTSTQHSLLTTANHILYRLTNRDLSLLGSRDLSLLGSTLFMGSILTSMTQQIRCIVSISLAHSLDSKLLHIPRKMAFNSPTVSPCQKVEIENNAIGCIQRAQLWLLSLFFLLKKKKNDRDNRQQLNSLNAPKDA